MGRVIAAVSLAAYAAWAAHGGWALADADELVAASGPVALAIAAGVASVGVWRGRWWARWLTVGLAASGIVLLAALDYTEHSPVEAWPIAPLVAACLAAVRMPAAADPEPVCTRIALVFAPALLAVTTVEGLSSHLAVGLVAVFPIVIEGARLCDRELGPWLMGHGGAATAFLAVSVWRDFGETYRTPFVARSVELVVVSMVAVAGLAPVVVHAVGSMRRAGRARSARWTLVAVLLALGVAVPVLGWRFERRSDCREACEKHRRERIVASMGRMQRENATIVMQADRDTEACRASCSPSPDQCALACDRALVESRVDAEQHAGGEYLRLTAEAARTYRTCRAECGDARAECERCDRVHDEARERAAQTAAEYVDSETTAAGMTFQTCVSACPEGAGDCDARCLDLRAQQVDAQKRAVRIEGESRERRIESRYGDCREQCSLF